MTSLSVVDEIFSSGTTLSITPDPRTESAGQSGGSCGPPVAAAWIFLRSQVAKPAVLSANSAGISDAYVVTASWGTPVTSVSILRSVVTRSAAGCWDVPAVVG